VQLYADDGHVRSLEQIEADVIRLAIGHYRGRMTEVARKLGIGRSTLYRKLHELGIDSDPEPRELPASRDGSATITQPGPSPA
jgi:DNA-binding NtrC family response regulator